MGPMITSTQYYQTKRSALQGEIVRLETQIAGAHAEIARLEMNEHKRQAEVRAAEVSFAQDGIASQIREQYVLGVTKKLDEHISKELQKLGWRPPVKPAPFGTVDTLSMIRQLRQDGATSDYNTKSRAFFNAVADRLEMLNG